MWHRRWGLCGALVVLGFLAGDNLAWRLRSVPPPPPSTTRDGAPLEAPEKVTKPTARPPPPMSSSREDEVRKPLRALPGLVVPEHQRVIRYRRYYSASAGRGSLAVWLQRAARYAPMIRGTLEQYGVPRDLMAVALVESGLQPDAVSPVGATGMWQFMTETARNYNLRVEEDFDERRDPRLATNAAARHLRDLHQEFRDWPLALAAYNAGVRRVRDLLAMTGAHDFWSLASHPDALPQETADYVPKVMAIASILRQLPQHGFAPIPGDPLGAELTAVAVPEGFEVAAIARAVGMEVRRVRELNPAVVGGRVPVGQSSLVLPRERVRLAELLALPVAFGPQQRDSLAPRVRRLARGAVLPSSELSCVIAPCAAVQHDDGWNRLLDAMGGESQRTYQVKSGDTPQKVADLFGIDPAQLMKENGLSDPRRIRVGQLLLVPAGSQL